MSAIVSVIMTAYNAQDYIGPAIESVLGQTFADFELLVVDDGSVDSTREIISGFAAKDPRVILICNEDNLGQPHSRNKAIDMAKGEFLAIMDADDISLPFRLEKQIRYLQVHPNVALVGTLASEICSEGKTQSQVRGDIRNEAQVFWAEITSAVSSVIHPTVMLRKSILDANQLQYNPETPYAQDKELWSRLLLVSDGVVLPECLLKYRVHQNSVSSSKTDKQRKYAIGVVVRMVRAFLSDETVSQETIEQMVSIGPSFKPDALAAWELKLRLLEAIEKSKRFNHKDMLRLRALELIRFKKWANPQASRQARISGFIKRLKADVSLWLILKEVSSNLMKKYKLSRLSRAL